MAGALKKQATRGWWVAAAVVTVAAIPLVTCGPAQQAGPAAPASSAPSAVHASSSPPTGTANASASSAPAPPVEIPPPPPPDPPIELTAGGKQAVVGKAGLVTSVEKHASEAGAEMLKRGGNAVDAAVATAFVLAVTHPSAGNVGGGGFMLIAAPDSEPVAIDFREIAPAAATTEKMMAMIDAGAIGYASTAVPGTVAGLAHAVEKYGSLPLAEVLKPAIDLARKGHRFGPRQGLALSWQWSKLKTNAEARKIFGPTGKAVGIGDLLKQPELADTLQRIADDGPGDFYTGTTAKLIVDAMKKNGGDITMEDLAAYEVKERKPLSFGYRGFVIHTMPPPSMGGIAVAQTLSTLERIEAHKAPVDSALSIHYFVEAAARSYAERRLVGADPDFYPKSMRPDAIEHLLSGYHLMKERPPIDPKQATPPTAIKHDPAFVNRESPETTHLSAVDAKGLAVSCTVTLSAGYGSKVVVPKTGVLLSNALGAFTEKGVNQVKKHKRMASSMSPTIAIQNGRPVLVLGSPGGDTIPNTVALVTRNLIDYGMTIDEAVLAGRVHHQWLPPRIRMEKTNAPSASVVKELEALGHEVQLHHIPIGDANNILIDAKTGAAYGFADPREGGKAVGIDEVIRP